MRQNLCHSCASEEAVRQTRILIRGLQLYNFVIKSVTRSPIELSKHQTILTISGQAEGGGRFTKSLNIDSSLHIPCGKFLWFLKIPHIFGLIASVCFENSLRVGAGNLY